MFKIIDISLRAIISNKVRSFLTVLGIIIGITAVIALLALGQGAQSSILSSVQNLGANTITILPTSLTSFGSRSDFEQLINSKLDSRLLPILKNKVNFPEVVAISPEISGSFEVSSDLKTKNNSINGVEPDYVSVRDLEVENGRFISPSDQEASRKVVVLGNDARIELFGESDPVGKKIEIKNNNFTIVGTLAEKSNEIDGRIYMPSSTAATQIVGSDDLNQIIVKVENEDQIDFTAGKIEQRLNKFYKVGADEDGPFSVLTTKDILSVTQTITGVFTALLASIASISLVVGGIGIMNIMLVSVTERTREIGLRKAVGAKQRAILSQFLTEAIILTMFGGLIGIVLGILLAYGIGSLSGIPVILSLQSIALATSVSAVIGIIFGFYPAYRAARLDPIDALRYE